MKTNYVLIDFESIQPQALETLAEEHFKVMVFVGASQAKISFDVAASLQQLGSNAEYIKISGNGPNALDFHIAYYIGRLAVVDPSAYFHIISKDTGFDPLIKHLRSQKIFAGRVVSVGDIPAVQASSSKLPQERIAVVIARLRQMKAAKPRSVKTLSSTITSLFLNQISEQEVATLVQNLVSEGYLEITGAKLTYALPSDA